MNLGKSLRQALTKALHLLRVLVAYHAHRRNKFGDRADLERHQQAKLRSFLHRISARSPYFSTYAGLPLAQWPVMDKAQMMAHFDAMNTAGLVLPDVMATAMRAELERDFVPRVKGYTVGLSSGTSAMRGAFAVSDAEAAQWAGVMLASALPDGLFAGERVALFLRANSQLYSAVQSRWIAFEYFDLFQKLSTHFDRLKQYQPSIIVAPAQVLKALALEVLAAKLNLKPKRVISVAEVLDDDDKRIIEQAFGRVHEIYQATEGFLGSTCALGVLHLNEAYLHIEPEWQDAEQRRFVPIITDFTRTTQPIIRYRLNDILTARTQPCTCGSAARAIEAIEGRCDDQWLLPTLGGGVQTVFADVLNRALARGLPLAVDYRLMQRNLTQLCVYADVSPAQWATLLQVMTSSLQGLGIDTSALAWELQRELPEQALQTKLRRISRMPFNID